MIGRIAVIAGGLLLAAAPAWAQQAAAAPQQVDLAIQGVGNVSAPLQVVLLLTLLSFLPAILMTMTSFTRIVIVFHFLRQALGTQEMPSNQILIGLALFLTMFIMAPVGDADQRRWRCSRRWPAQITVTQALERGAPPLRDVHAEADARDRPRAVRRARQGSRGRRRPTSCRCAWSCRPSSSRS